MTVKQKEAIVEAVKEGARVALMALVTWGLARFAVLPQTETVLIGTLVLRVVDKFLHESGVADKGLTRF